MVFKLILTFALVMPGFSYADRIEDVKILEVAPGIESFKLKLRAPGTGSEAFFFLEIVKSDPQAFEKTMAVINKMQKKDRVRLDLDIPSFSPTPSGSFYRSEGIQVITSSEREPNSEKKSKNKK